MKQYRVGDTFKGWNEGGERIVGTVRGILKTKWSTWMSINTSSGVRLVRA